MRNPVLVELVRGALVESRHRGAVAVVDADGASVLALGDVAQPVPRVPSYPRNCFAITALAKLAFFGEVVWMPAEGVERYKEYAAECLRIAQQTRDDAQKARLLEMAEAWQRLAEMAAKHDKK